MALQWPAAQEHEEAGLDGATASHFDAASSILTPSPGAMGEWSNQLDGVHASVRASDLRDQKAESRTRCRVAMACPPEKR